MFSQHGCLCGVCPSAHVHSYQGGVDLEVSPHLRTTSMCSIGKLNNKRPQNNQTTCYNLIYHLYQLSPYLHTLHIVDLELRACLLTVYVIYIEIASKYKHEFPLDVTPPSVGTE